MNRRTRTLIVMAIALVCATAATGAVLFFVKRLQKPTPSEPQTQVVVASRAVGTGMVLGESDVKVIQWPARTPVRGAYKDKNDVIKRGLLASVVENEPLTDTKLAPKNSGGGLMPKIQQGKRAVSIKVNEVIGVAGFVVPGAHVDVLVTIRRDTESRSRVVVSNAEVLTAGTRFDQDQAKDGKPIPTTVVTLMVDPPNAERLALAAAEGQILLTLRNPLDREETKTAGVGTASLLAAEPPPMAPVASPNIPVSRPKPAAKPVATVGTAAPVAPVAPKPYEIDTIRGGKKTKEVLR